MLILSYETNSMRRIIKNSKKFYPPIIKIGGRLWATSIFFSNKLEIKSSWFLLSIPKVVGSSHASTTYFFSLINCKETARASYAALGALYTVVYVYYVVYYIII